MCVVSCILYFLYIVYEKKILWPKAEGIFFWLYTDFLAYGKSEFTCFVLAALPHPHLRIFSGYAAQEKLKVLFDRSRYHSYNGALLFLLCAREHKFVLAIRRHLWRKQKKMYAHKKCGQLNARDDNVKYMEKNLISVRRKGASKLCTFN